MHLSVVCWRRRNYAPVSSMLLLDEGATICICQQYARGGGTIHLSVVCWMRGQLYPTVNSMLEDEETMHLSVVCWRRGDYAPVSSMLEEGATICICQQYSGRKGSRGLYTSQQYAGGGGNYIHLSIECWRRGGLCTCQQYARRGGHYMHMSIVCWKRGDYAPVSSMLEEGGLCTYQQYAGGRGNYMHLSIVCWRKRDYAPVSSIYNIFLLFTPAYYSFTGTNIGANCNRLVYRGGKCCIY